MLDPINDNHPLALQVVDPADIVVADVREDLRNGREPFHPIMAARDKVPAEGALVVRATFEPEPLYRVMAKSGWSHHTEQLETEDWRVWFYRDVKVLDVRELEPPEPLVHTLNATADLAPGEWLVQLNSRVPHFLFPRLTEQGFTYHVREVSPGRVHVVIRRPTEAADSTQQQQENTINV